MKALKGKILVRMDEKPKEYRTTSGLVLAAIKIKDTDRFATFGEGIVLSLGAEKTDRYGNPIPHEVKVGDRIIWQRYAEIRMPTNEAILDESAIIGIVDSDGF